MNDYTLENMVGGSQSSTYHADDVWYSAVEVHYDGKAADKDTGYAARAPVDPEAIAFNEGYASNSVKFIFEMSYTPLPEEGESSNTHEHGAVVEDDLTASIAGYHRAREIGEMVQGFMLVERRNEC